MTDLCGGDGTQQFYTFHDTGYLILVTSDIIGELGNSAGGDFAPQQQQTTSPAPPPTAITLPPGTTSNPFMATPVRESEEAIKTSTPANLSTSSPSSKIVSAPVNDRSGAVLMHDVEQHNTPDNCWTIYDNVAYDVTAYAPTHPGGKFFSSRSMAYYGVIQFSHAPFVLGALLVTNLCGKDGSEQFRIFHPTGYLALIATSIIGELSDESEETPTVPTAVSPRALPVTTPAVVPTQDGNHLQTQIVVPTMHPSSKNNDAAPAVGGNEGDDAETILDLSMEEVEKHSNPDDCWTIYNGVIYDVTAYAPTHPGGKFRLIRRATDAE